MYDGLMKETWWAKPPTTIDMYAIKKHLDENPEFKDKNIYQMGKKDFEKLEKTEWAQLLKNKRPSNQIYTKPKIISSQI